MMIPTSKKYTVVGKARFYSLFIFIIVSHEHHFKDKYLFYRFHGDEIPTRVGTPETPDKQEILDAEEDLADVLGLLLHVGPDAMLRMILRKP